MLDDHDAQALHDAISHALGGFAGSPEMGGGYQGAHDIVGSSSLGGFAHSPEAGGREYNTGSSLGGMQHGPGGSVAASQQQGGMMGQQGPTGDRQTGSSLGGFARSPEMGGREYNDPTSIANAVNRGGMDNGPGYGYGGFIGLDPLRGIRNPTVAGGKTSLPGSTFNKSTFGNDVAMTSPPTVPTPGTVPFGTGSGRAALAALAGLRPGYDPSAAIGQVGASLPAMADAMTGMPSIAQALTGSPFNPSAAAGFVSNPPSAAANALDILGAGTLAQSRLPKDQERVPQDPGAIATNPFESQLPMGLPPAPDPAAAARRGLVPGALPGLLSGTADVPAGPVPGGTGTLQPSNISIAAGETFQGGPFNQPPSATGTLVPGAMPGDPSYFGDIPSYHPLPSPDVPQPAPAPAPGSYFSDIPSYKSHWKRYRERIDPEQPPQEAITNYTVPIPRAKPPVPIRTRDYKPIIPRDHPRPPLPSRVPPAQPRGGFVPPVPMRAEDRRMYGLPGSPGRISALANIFGGGAIRGAKGTNTLNGGAGVDLLTTPAYPLHGPGGSIAAASTPGGMMGTTPMAPSRRGDNAQYDRMQEVLAGQQQQLAAKRKKTQDAQQAAAEDAAAADEARRKRRKVIPKPRGLL